MNPVIRSGSETYEDRLRAWDASRRRDPCDICGKTHEKYHHASCFGQNFCHDCYLREKPVVQCYPGDEGFAPWFGNFPARSGA